MRWLYPRLPAHRLPIMIRTAIWGAAIAAGYGAAHDQLSFALSPEYFTKLKFRQFAWADLGLPPWLFASEVGILATWWVGLVAGWLLARVGLAELDTHERQSKTVRAFGQIAVAALIGGFLGWLFGATASRRELSGWGDWQRNLGIEDLPAFVVVAHLHAGGYLGALTGLLLALVSVSRNVTRSRRAIEQNKVSASKIQNL